MAVSTLRRFELKYSISDIDLHLEGEGVKINIPFVVVSRGNLIAIPQECGKTVLFWTFYVTIYNYTQRK